MKVYPNNKKRDHVTEIVYFLLNDKQQIEFIQICDTAQNHYRNQASLYF